MSIFDEFDRLRNTVDSLMGNFDAGLTGGRRRSRVRDPFLSDWDMGLDPWSSSFGMMPMLTPLDQPLLTSGGMGKGEDAKMQEGGGQQLTTTGGQEQRVGQPLGAQLPVLRCRVNVEDTKDKYIVTAEVPGFDKQNLKVNISDDNILTISGEQKKEHVEQAKDKSYLRTERSFGSVQRSLRLPKNVSRDQVSASYENGILHVNIPKVEQSDKSAKPIEIA